MVDDNPATRYATARVLRAAGFSTQEAATGQDALAMARADQAAVVLDVHLPDIDGFEVCRLLRQAPATARLPVVHLSGAYIQNDDKVRGLDLGADAYMVHPVEPALLVATVRTLVRARNAEEGMRRSEARFREIYTQAFSGICLIDAAGRFTEVNPAMLALLGRTAEAVVGTPVVALTPPDWQARVTGYLAQGQQGVWRGEFPLLNAAGGIVHLAWSLSAHVEAGISMAIATDISERTLLSGQREDMLEREQAARVAAERVSRSKDELIAVLSHELRTPLNAILTWVHVLQRGDGVKNLDKGLAAIERNAQAQRRLISDLLDMSRMDLGKLHLELELVDLTELVRYCLDMLATLMRDKSLEASLEVSGTPWPVMADRARLQQVFWNLLTNAIKFSEPGGRLTVAIEHDVSDVRLTVRDEGQGIKPEFLPHLFDRFSQSDAPTNRHHGGLGLGLSIVKQLAELHGGTVVAHSEGLGQGASFVVTLPARRGEPAPATPLLNDTDPVRASEPMNLAPLRIVVVEDDADAREILGMILQNHGAAVRLATGYDEALALIDESMPDVLVSDIGMPGKDGYDLIREIRRREQAAEAARLPVIALTAFARLQDRETASGHGFDAHCAKPLKVHDLLATILRITDPAWRPTSPGELGA